MAKIDVLDAAGSKSGSRDLSSELFESKVSVPLMHQVVVAGLAGLRAGTHSTKTRGDVRGGGKKPWRQKGTGRARQGSIRSPQWVGGGVAHGPHPHSHAHVNKKMRKGALRSALTDTLRAASSSWWPTLRSTSPRRSGRRAAGRAGPEGQRAASCCPSPPRTARSRSPSATCEARVAYAGGLGTYELLWADRVLFTAAALDRLDERRSDAPSTAAETEGDEEVADEVSS